MNEIINELNNLKFLQKEFDLYDIPAKLYKKYFQNVVEQYIDEQEEREGYITSINAYEYKGDYIGVRLISAFDDSENHKIKDFKWILRFFEMEPYETISYKIKY